ncbi:phosphodiester glycosidase family protein [Catenulispora yoronensis]|uniref:phosphodiester glycosidase family protein n=1 Tax=Catenulispora yoronensis TaxID=450799 RepID=UPI0031D20EC9
MSAKSEELEGLREGEPVDGVAAGTGADDAVDPLAETRVVATVDEPREGDALGATHVDARAVDAVPVDAVPVDAVPVDAVPRDRVRDAVQDLVQDPVQEVAQDVAEETARAVAEAADDGATTASVATTATTATAAATATADAAGNPRTDAAEPRFPARREHHTFLYGRGKRVLPWKHKARLTPPQRRRRKIVVRSLWGGVLVVCGTIGWSVAGALTSPGTDTVQARLAEWGRDHGLGGVVSTLEQWQYDLDPPTKGGAVDARQFSDLGPTTAPGAAAAVPTKPGKAGATPGKSGSASAPAPDTIAMQPRLPAPAGLALESGEGVFAVAVATADGQPVVQVARIRPDAEYTDVAADVAWIDQKHSRYVLHPGHEGDLNKTITAVPNQINTDARPGLIALFNGGFKISESHGGYFDHGVTAAPLVDGAASEVIFKDGHMAIGMWGRDFSTQKNPDIVSVRQNLRLMVDNGQVVPYINDSATWGRADHGSAAVWRSGVGVTAAGDIVWVGGNKLTAPSLARLLKDAGAVRAMQLDINLRWADFQYFPARDGNPDNSKLYEDFLQGPNKFFVNSTKDFMAVYLR